MDLQQNIKAWFDADPGLAGAHLTPLYAEDEAPDNLSPPFSTIASVEEEAVQRSTGNIYSTEGFEIKLFGTSREQVYEYLLLFRAALKDGMSFILPGGKEHCFWLREQRKRYVKEDDGGFRVVWSVQIDLEASLSRPRTDNPT